MESQGYVIEVENINSIKMSEKPGICIKAQGAGEIFITVDKNNVTYIKGINFNAPERQKTSQDDRDSVDFTETKKRRKTAEQEWDDRVKHGVRLSAVCPNCGDSSISTCRCAKSRFLEFKRNPYL